MTPDEFIAAIYPAAVASSKTTGVPASFTIAQAALESGWGSHAPGCNLFGIKADVSWHGEFTEKRTLEVIKGVSQTVTAKFRAYPNWQACMDDHAQFFLVNPRYKPALACNGDGCEFARRVAKAGYATDPKYADKIISIITKHNLDRFYQGEA